MILAIGAPLSPQWVGGCGWGWEEDLPNPRATRGKGFSPRGMCPEQSQGLGAPQGPPLPSKACPVSPGKQPAPSCAFPLSSCSQEPSAVTGPVCEVSPPAVLSVLSRAAITSLWL